MSSPAPEPLCGGTAWADHSDIPDVPYDMHDPDQWCIYLAMATDILWAASGRRWRGSGRTATATLRAAPPDGDGWAYHRSWGHCPCYSGLGVLGPTWGLRSGHYEPSRVRLPHDDVTAVTSVLVDGESVTGWHLEGSWLVRTGGRGWPMCEDRTVIAYAYGRNPPAAGIAMCVELAVELGREGATSPDRECRLPRRASTVVRQGLTYTTETYLEYLQNSLTGLLGPDLWLRSVNPKGRSQAASVWSPDTAYARRTS